MYTDLFDELFKFLCRGFFSIRLHNRTDLVSLYFGGFTGLIDLNLIVIPGFATAQSAFLSLKGPFWTINPDIVHTDSLQCPGVILKLQEH